MTRTRAPLRIVHAPIAAPADALIVLDKERRLYVGLSRDGSYFHLIQPTQFDLVDHNTDEVLRPAGTLECRCRGFSAHGHCYVANAAIAFEDQAAMPAMFRREVAPETELERAAARG